MRRKRNRKKGRRIRRKKSKKYRIKTRDCSRKRRTGRRV